MELMRAVVAEELRRPMEVVDVPIPDIGDDDVLVRPSASGICRTDWHVWNGDWTWCGLTLPLPITLGHEIGGVVERVGADVRRFKPGMRVCVPFNFADGDCPYCRKGLSNLCDNASWGFTTPGSGGFAQFARVPNADLNCVALPANVTEKDGAALGCRYMTSFRAVRSRAQVQAGETVVVVGDGGVGRSAVQIAAAMGALVVAIDTKDSALDASRAMGASHTINSSGLTPEEVRESLNALVGSRGADVAIDAMGGRNSTLTSLHALAKGGRLCVAGLTTQDDQGEVALPIDLMVFREWSLVGTLGNPHADYPELLRLVDSGKLQPSRLITEEVALGDVQSIFDRMPTFETEGFVVVTDFN
ncbi:alcohol dehydrogenase catalytic domain-containing protein [Albimonas pacifica]|uniref:Alcohol dehydrogenase, propanol-preferring n=1 Tax=Albimonas pacifica TaxID=1114924 RepID=A0A1I3CVD4_9RHOB|nr:alcohol dehydrogenase catalytic domain-containing protein [Albimonas pacifica]SFH78336.1 alcohol dehydrogenase, propanol-preferring [Albimonas pacifica]